MTVIATVFALHRQATRQPNPRLGVIFCQFKCTSQLARCHKHDKIIPLFTAPCDTSVRNSGTVTLIGIMAQIRFYFFISWLNQVANSTCRSRYASFLRNRWLLSRDLSLTVEEMYFRLALHVSWHSHITLLHWFGASIAVANFMFSDLNRLYTIQDLKIGDNLNVSWHSHQFIMYCGPPSVTICTLHGTNSTSHSKFYQQR